MRVRLVPLVLFLVPLAPASATDIVPTVIASVHDQPLDGAGDTFNATPFEGLIRTSASLEDRAIQEFDVSAFTGATLASATLSGTVYVNNAFDVGVRGFDFVVYGGNGAADLTDFQIAATLVGMGSYHPPLQSSFTYSFDATSAVQALITGGATWIGLRVQGNTNPNFPNILDNATSKLALVAASSIGTPFCFGDGSGTACPCGNSGLAGNGCANSSFVSGAHLTATGNAGASAGTDTLVLTASNITGPGLFFQGTGTAAGGAGFPFGDGLLCVSAGIIRMGIVFPTGNSASYPGGLTPAPIHVAGAPIAAGDLRHYQCWYRDAVAFCAPDTFNLTQGLSVTFGP
jgi:hypothetical protein